MSVTAATVALLIAIARGQNIVMMSMKTGNQAMVGDTSSVDLEIVNSNFDSCVMLDLQYFESYSIKSYEVRSSTFCITCATGRSRKKLLKQGNPAV